MWRSWPDRAGAEALILQTIEETRAAGGTGLVWHTGDAVSPPFMDDALAQRGFEKTEDLDVLAFELGADPEPNLPDLRVPHDVSPHSPERRLPPRRQRTPLRPQDRCAS